MVGVAPCASASGGAAWLPSLRYFRVTDLCSVLAQRIPLMIPIST